MEMPWTCIALTCTSEDSVILAERELDILQKKGCISKNTMILVIEDPFENIGSGAATLNALFVITEHLSALNEYSIVNTDVLQEAYILILHCGRQHVFDSGNLKAFVNIPLIEPDLCNKGSKEIVQNIEHVIHFVTSLQQKSKPGIWVSSTDMTFSYHSLEFNFGAQEDPIIICVESSLDYATKHGVVIHDEDSFVKNIHYCCSQEIIEPFVKNNSVSIVAGIVYLPISLAESMLAFHSISPIDSCTYIGVDGGSEPLQISLFFDILVVMATEVEKDAYLLGKCGKIYEDTMNFPQRKAIISAREKIWNFLSMFKLKKITLKDVKYIYWDERLSAKNHITNVKEFNTINCSGCSTGEMTNGMLNSIIESPNVTIGCGTLVSNCKLSAREIDIGNNCFIAGVCGVLGPSENISIPDCTVILEFFQCPNKEKICIIFGSCDILSAQLNELDISSPLLKYLEITGLAKQPNERFKPLRDAKIYPITWKLSDWLQFLNRGSMEFCSMWDQRNLVSISDILKNISIKDTADWNKIIKNQTGYYFIAENLKWESEISFIPFFKIACLEERAFEVLKVLDNVTFTSTENSFILRRTLSSIADLLGIMAGNVGKMRSGPGNNKSWDSAFQLLREGNIENALNQLIEKRQKWVHRKDFLIRASRHYDRALQILIECAVITSKEYINLSERCIPKLEEWIVAECPCRIDLQGGWTDTPPICFEMGGSVVNVAIEIDGRKPIGAKAKRISEPKLVLVLRDEEIRLSKTLEIRDLNDLLDYNQPAATGALLKAAFVCTETVSVTNKLTLEEQLTVNGGGIELHAWSTLPHGSGLGTSSILAGAVIAVLWTITGRLFDKSSLIHSVLYLEQLLTTGGGWQDQVAGLLGGINRGYSQPKLPLKVEFQKISPSCQVFNLLNEHLLLLYTGKVRLAKNLLQNVIRNWYAKEKEIILCFKQLILGSRACAEAIENGNLSQIGEEMSSYWQIKKKLAPGCEPAIVSQLMGVLQPETFGQLLVGAGGGGFMCILTKNPNQRKEIEKIVKDNNFPNTVTVHSIEIDLEGIVLSIKGRKIQLD